MHCRLVVEHSATIAMRQHAAIRHGSVGYRMAIDASTFELAQRLYIGFRISRSCGPSVQIACLRLNRRLHAFVAERPAVSSGPKTSIGQSIQLRSSQKRHVVSAESVSVGSLAVIVSAIRSSAARSSGATRSSRAVNAVRRSANLYRCAQPSVVKSKLIILRSIAEWSFLEEVSLNQANRTGVRQSNNPTELVNGHGRRMTDYK
jgi:hypothetical protein